MEICGICSLSQCVKSEPQTESLRPCATMQDLVRSVVPYIQRFLYHHEELSQVHSELVDNNINETIRRLQFRQVWRRHVTFLIRSFSSLSLSFSGVRFYFSVCTSWKSSGAPKRRLVSQMRKIKSSFVFSQVGKLYIRYQLDVVDSDCPLVEMQDVICLLKDRKELYIQKDHLDARLDICRWDYGARGAFLYSLLHLWYYWRLEVLQWCETSTHTHRHLIQASIWRLKNYDLLVYHCCGIKCVYFFLQTSLSATLTKLLSSIPSKNWKWLVHFTNWSSRSFLL